MSDSCCAPFSENQVLQKKQRRVLWVVFFINLIMFFVEFGFGLISNSVALVGDSLDMLGDSIAYGVSLYAVGKDSRMKARVSQIKAYLMILLGLFVFFKAIYHVYFSQTPQVEIMGVIGFIALVANIFCLVLLTKRKDDDLNFKSVWLCSRNDIIANFSVLVAAFLVFWLNQPWPDLVAGLGITVLFLRSAFHVLSDAKKILN